MLDVKIKYKLDSRFAIDGKSIIVRKSFDIWLVIIDHYYHHHSVFVYMYNKWMFLSPSKCQKACSLSVHRAITHQRWHCLAIHYRFFIIVCIWNGHSRRHRSPNISIQYNYISTVIMIVWIFIIYSWQMVPLHQRRAHTMTQCTMTLSSAINMLECHSPAFRPSLLRLVCLLTILVMYLHMLTDK